MKDRKGNIWTRSEGANAGSWALSRHNEQLLPSKISNATRIKEEEGMLFGILEDKEGGIWFGTLNGECRYDGKSFNCFKDE